MLNSTIVLQPNGKYILLQSYGIGVVGSNLSRSELATLWTASKVEAAQQMFQLAMHPFRDMGVISKERQFREALRQIAELHGKERMEEIQAAAESSRTIQPQPAVGSKWVHRKGTEYLVTAVANATSEDRETLVVYYSLTTSQLFARPLATWRQKMEALED